MRTLNRNKRTVYVAKRVKGEKADTYATPVRVSLNLVTASSYTDILAFGDKHTDRMRGVISQRDDIFDVKDKVYVGTTPPSETDVLAKDADFIVESRSIGLDTNTVTLVRTVAYRG